nr:putative molybdenum carrier protein [uncultured Desulfobulbus sp.]
MLKGKKKKSFFCIISGGQTGADQAALDAAINLGLDHGGWIPKGRKTEAGPLPSHYQLKEHSSPQYRVRTESNVVSADGTLICSFGPLSGGSALTEALAIRHNRPFLHINFDHTPPEQAHVLVEHWVKQHAIVTLNVAGPRASNDARIYQAVYALLTAISWPSK